MSLFTIEKSLCGRDGKCVQVCPANIIEQKTKDSYPTLVDGYIKGCINCGHCMAVCPSGALKLHSMNPEKCPEYKASMLPNPEEVKLFLTSRRSIRNFYKDPVERHLLEELLHVTSYAPSGHNGQPLKWIVVGDSKEVNKLAGLTIDWMRTLLQVKPSGLQKLVDDWDAGIDRICRGAPQLIVAYSPKRSHPPQIDCTIALAYLELAAHSMGLGACWAGFLSAAAQHYPPLTEDLEIPEGHQCYGAMMIGYPKYRFKRIPLRNKPSVTWR